MKRLVICCDGTWQSALQNTPATNVQRVVELLAKTAQMPDGRVVPQVVFYDEGIGSIHDHLAGGLTGKGIQHNIKQCYHFLMNNYEPGDELYCFGFSRGAFTVRSLVGMLYNCGILKKSHHAAASILEAFVQYKSKDPRYHPDRKHETFGSDDRYWVKVDGLFVFDTVGALGLPGRFIKSDARAYAFHDVKLNKDVRKARHALALDETRRDYAPSLWTHKPAHTDSQQLWFVGDHSDVGGGHGPWESGLSLVTLQWMMEASGLTFLGEQLEQLLHDSQAKIKVHNAFRDASFLQKLVSRYKGQQPRRVDERGDSRVSKQARNYMRLHPNYKPRALLFDDE